MQPADRTSLITLTTDFGTLDHYVGTMKGVILSRCPSARLIDISHEIAAFSLYSAAYAIDQAAPFYPTGTIHVVVVDPGVGTARRAVLVEAIGQYFLAPDNGVLSMIAARDNRHKSWVLSNRQLWLDAPSATFHGRDVFAPVAASLACGAALANQVGPPIDTIELLAGLEAQQPEPGVWLGKILSVDRFGNVITNFRAAQFPLIPSQSFELIVSEGSVTLWSRTFGLANPTECFAYFGSSGYIELAMNQQSAAHFLKASPGGTIRLQLFADHT